MTYTSKITALLVTTGLLTTLALTAAEKNATQDYKLRLLKDCTLVSEQIMTSSQVAAYKSLQDQEKLMHGLELPITAITEQIEQYSSEIEKLSALAVQETENSIHIDKTYMQQQEAAAEKLQQLMSAHQSDFDALESQGAQIGQVAKVFEQEIAPSVANIDHDRIQIIGPNDKASSRICYSGISHI